MTLAENLHTRLQEQAEQKQFSGVVRLTRRDGVELFAGAYGYANRPWSIPNALHMRFEIASMTKLFTAVSALQLIDLGKFSFETPVIPYLGITETSISTDVTVFHLLTHTSGIADDADEEAGEDYADLWKTNPNYAVVETADFLPQFIHKQPNFPPGQQCRYNNVAFVLLGLMIEKAAGLPYRDYVRRYVFAPANMSHSDFLHMAGVYQNVAQGYTALEDNDGKSLGWQTPIYMRPPIGSPDGGAYTTAADMGRFWEAVWNGRLLSPALSQAFLTPQVFYRTNGDFDYHYGYAVYFAQQRGKLQFYLGQGEDNGVSTKSVYFPAHDVLAVMLANQDFCTWPLVWQVYEMLQQESH